MPLHSPQASQAPQDASAVRKKVLADENTAEIARNLGVSTEEYVDQVVHFLLHAREEPWLYVIEDHDLRAMGLEPPGPEEMGRFVLEAARLAQAAEGKLELVPAQGLARFSQSPFGKLLVNVELSSVTGGASGQLSRGLGILGQQGGGKLLGAFKGFASRYLGPVQSFLSKPGLWGIAGFITSAANPGQLLSMARVLFGTRQKAPAPDASTRHLIQHNLMQLFAHRHALLAS
jgi:hypothetical protein